MGWLDRFRRREKRNFTSMAMAEHFAAVHGSRGLAELTGTVQGCVSLWEQGLSLAETTEPLLTPEVLGLAARSMGFKGEAVFVIRGDRLVPVAQWDIATSGGQPTAYRVTIADVGGGKSDTVLADEVLHFRIGADMSEPWRGTAPLKRASLTANTLHAIEDTLADVYQNAPIGSLIAPMPENPDVDNAALGRSFRGQRGRVLLRESTVVTAAGGPVPTTDWKPSQLSPNLADTMAVESLREARDSIAYAFGVLPILLNNQTTGPAVREAQRHLAQWQLQPIAVGIAREASHKLGAAVDMDVMQPLQAYDAGGRARALSGVIQGLAAAKESGLSDEQIQLAMKFAGID